MKFIGHLDMMRYFQKAMRRADIDIAYSEGFSPHQIMSFAAPLGVGITSDGEYLDIEVHSTRSSYASLEALNEVMVEGVRVFEYKMLPEGTPNAMSSVAAADYTIFFKEQNKNPFEDENTLSEALDMFYQQQEEIMITKQTKKSERTMDLKPLIYDLTVVDKQNNPGFFLKVCTGSTDNIKPELVLEAFFDYCRIKQLCDYRFEPMDIQIHRNEVYARTANNGFIPLGELGQEIL